MFISAFDSLAVWLQEGPSVCLWQCFWPCWCPEDGSTVCSCLPLIVILWPWHAAVDLRPWHPHPGSEECPRRGGGGVWVWVRVKIPLLCQLIPFAGSLQRPHQSTSCMDKHLWGGWLSAPGSIPFLRPVCRGRKSRRQESHGWGRWGRFTFSTQSLAVHGGIQTLLPVPRCSRTFSRPGRRRNRREGLSFGRFRCGLFIWWRGWIQWGGWQWIVWRGRACQVSGGRAKGKQSVSSSQGPWA